MKHIGANSQYLYTVPNLSGGTVLSYNTTTKQVTHRTYAEIIGDMNLVTTNTDQNISGQKSFEKIIVSTSPDSVTGNLGTLGTNYKLALTNDGNYGTAFWIQGNGQGYIQQQRFDNNPIAYRLNLQPLGGELFYGASEVATRAWTTANFPETPDGYSISISGSDLNTLMTTGFYRGTVLTNAPNSGWFYVTVESHDSGAWCKQSVTSYGSDNNPNETYQRVRLAGAWQPWRRI